MTKAFDRASDLEMEERERLLNQHLKRVKELPDEYGFCNDCGAAIPAKRLRSLPYAATPVAAVRSDLLHLSGHQRT
ncbi:TPA: TraR/DksA C4-type zinc finger protein [Klebsiella pneumoniae]